MQLYVHDIEKAEVEQDLAFAVNGRTLVNICEEIDNFNRGAMEFASNSFFH